VKKSKRQFCALKNPSPDPWAQNKMRYSQSVEVALGRSGPILAPLPQPPSQTQPPGERAQPARRPAASKRKKHLDFQDRIYSADTSPGETLGPVPFYPR
jgi:hypothetical protein